MIPQPLNTSYHLMFFLKKKVITDKHVYNVLLSTHRYANILICISVCVCISLYLNFRITQDYFKLLLNQSLNLRKKISHRSKLSHPGLQNPFPFPTKHLKSEKKSQTTFFKAVSQHL